MSGLILYAADPSALTILARQFGALPGIQIQEERRKLERRKLKRMYDKGQRSGTERRKIPILRGSFALTEMV